MVTVVALPFDSVAAVAVDTSPVLVWARQLGGTVNSQGNGVAVDAGGNVYTTGTFQGAADFDPGPGTFNLTSVGDRGEVFVSKLDSAGNLVWARQLGGISESLGEGVAVDAGGNVYTTGSFGGTADFDPGPGTFNLTGVGGFDGFVSKLDSAGDFVWARQLGGTDSDEGLEVAVDSAGNVYTTGRFAGTADFDPGPGTFNLTAVEGLGLSDVFVSKLDSAGNFVWARQLGGINTDIGRGVAVDAGGSVYTIGEFQGTADFDPGPGTLNLTSAGQRDVFVSKLDSAGNFVWAKQLGGSNTDRGRAVALDAAGNVHATGLFSRTVDFDPGPGTFNLTAAGSNFSSDVFVWKLDSGGNLVWAKQLGGTESDRGHGVALDAGGDVYTTGFFFGTADFDPGPENLDLTSVGGNDVFVSKLDSDGNLVWATRTGGTSNDLGSGVAVDAARNVYTTGQFSGTADFDPGPGTFNLTSFAPFGDVFVTKFSQGLDGLVLWNRLGSTEQVENSEVGAPGIMSGGSFTTGVFGDAYLASHDEDLMLEFPLAAFVPAASRGTMEFWARLIDPPTDIADSGIKLATPIPDPFGGPVYEIGLGSDDGMGGGGLNGRVSDGFDPASTSSGASGSWTYEDVLGPDVEEWHHYALVWDETGIAGVDDGSRAVAVFLDGALESGQWQQPMSVSFQAPDGGMLGILGNTENQGSVAMDNLKIWDYPKIDFTDRFDEGPLGVAHQVVDCATDSLQEAIDNAAKGGTVEVLPSTCFENISIRRDVTVIGTYGQSTIDAAGSGTGVNIAPWTDVHLDNLVVTGGGATGIISRGTTEISNSIIRENGNPFSFVGGVANIGATADMIVRDSIISDNTGGECGGMRNGEANFPVVGEAHALVTNTLVTGNTGSVGGICNGDPFFAQDDFAFMTIVDSTITGNTGFGLGSGADSQPVLTVIRTAVTENAGGGVILSFNGGFEMRDSLVAGNLPGFDDFFGPQPGDGIVGGDSPAMVSNTTISGNAGIGFGGVAGTIVNSTVTGNAVGIEQGPTLSVGGTIVFANGDGCIGDYTSLGYNVTGETCFPDPLPTDIVVNNAKLGPLADNGGQTLTHALLASSPAIDHIPPVDCFVATDQRGFGRPSGAGCDAGAFEAGAEDTPDPSIDADFAFGHTFGTSPVTLTGTAVDNVGVDMVRVAIRNRNNGLWLQDDMTTFGPFNRFDATLTNPGQPNIDWSYMVPLPDGNYALSARATDLAGNDQSISPWRYFNVDANDTTDLSIDADFAFGHTFGSSPVTLTGTAVDNVGVDMVRVAIRNRNNGLWLQDDMTTFGPFNRFDATLTNPGQPNIDWSFIVPLPDGNYALSARATDLAGNEQSISPWRHFNVDANDATDPSIDADFAFGHTFGTSPVTLSGAASDNVGVDMVRVAIRNRNNGLWLQDDMTTFGPFHRFDATLTNPGQPATDWSYMVPLPDGNYALSARATDLAGNDQSISPWRHFNIG